MAPSANTAAAAQLHPAKQVQRLQKDHPQQFATDFPSNTAISNMLDSFMKPRHEGSRRSPLEHLSLTTKDDGTVLASDAMPVAGSTDAWWEGQTHLEQDLCPLLGSSLKLGLPLGDQGASSLCSCHRLLHSILCPPGQQNPPGSAIAKLTGATGDGLLPQRVDLHPINPQFGSRMIGKHGGASVCGVSIKEGPLLFL